MAGRTRTTNVRKKQRRRKWRTSLLFIAIILFITVSIAGCVTFYKVKGAIESMHQDPGHLHLNHTTNGTDIHNDKNSVHNGTDGKDGSNSVSVLILGIDSRAHTTTLNTDVMMVAVFNPLDDHVTLLSIPRDTRVGVPGYSDYRKINSVYALGVDAKQNALARHKPVTVTGTSLVKDVLGDLLQIPIQYYVRVDFQSFKSVIDALNGVEINVDRTLIYDDPTDNTHIYLKKGNQILNGEEALDYVRHRKDNRGPNFYSSDFDRNRRQRRVVEAIVDKMKSFEGLRSFYGLLDVAGKHVRTDIDMGTLSKMALTYGRIGSEGMTILDNHAYWDSSIGFTVIPDETLSTIRQTLEEEMGLHRYPTK